MKIDNIYRIPVPDGWTVDRAWLHLKSGGKIEPHKFGPAHIKADIGTGPSGDFVISNLHDDETETKLRPVARGPLALISPHVYFGRN